jgi:hypothetical protein
MSFFMFPFSIIYCTFGHSYFLQKLFLYLTRHDRTNFMSLMLTCNVKDEHAKKIAKLFFDSITKLNRMVFERSPSTCKIMPED